jgi:two-component system response regulator MprA
MPRRPTLLIVDDDPAVTEMFARMLRLEGYAVLKALTTESGLQEAAVARPDGILLDLRMPIADGLDFLRRLRAREFHRQTPVAVVTGDYCLEEKLSRELRDLGAAVYFKPLWLDDLLEITHGLLRRA